MPDRIVGPLTMIQFVEAVLGGGLAYICYTSLPAPLGMLLAVLAAVLTLAIVFVKINERPFLFYLGAFIRYLFAPKQRIWQKNSTDNFQVEIFKAPKNTGAQIAHKDLSRDEIAKFAQKLDSQEINNIKVKS